MDRNRWSPEDVAKLQSMARKYPTARIAADLGRSVAATALKAHQLQISLRMKPKRGRRLDTRAPGLDLTS